MPQMGVKNRNTNANNSIDKRNSGFKSEKFNQKKKAEVFEYNTLYESTNGKFNSMTLLQIR